MATKNKGRDALNKLKEAPLAQAPAQEELPIAAENPPESRAVTFWLDEDTQQVFKELRMLLASEGVKFNDSLILRTVVDLLPKDDGRRRFVERAQELKQRDGRKLRLQKSDARDE